MATYTPSGGSVLNFRLLVDPPQRETRQTVSERLVPGTNRSIIDIVGKSVTKIRGTARFDSFGALKTFEGVVGSQGVLVYSEEPAGLNVIFVSCDRNRVTPQDIHLANVEFWIIPPAMTGFPAGPRQVTVSATAVGPVSGTVSMQNILSAQVTYGFDSRTGECRLTMPVKPACTYDDVLTVTMGAGGLAGTTSPPVRFVGLVRDFEYQDNPPGVQMIAKGYLIRAIEYENHEETFNNPWLGAGGILIGDIVHGTGSGGSNVADSATIVKAVLDKAGLSGLYNPAHILGSGVQYGGGADPKYFLWHSGGAGLFTVPMPQEQGETAMSYIERYDAIDAEVTGPNTGGRYRTFETVGGDVYRLRVGGRPQSTEDHTLTEGVDILGGQFTRSIADTRNYFVVKGQYRVDGSQFGALAYALQSSNPFQPSTTQHTYSFSSDMIEKAQDADPGTGISCETLANAFNLEYNREQVTGWLETWRDDLFGLAQTHLVQGGPGGTVGALGLAEKVWVQSVTISVNESGFTQRMSYLGGGLPETMSADLAFLNAELAAAA